VSVIFLDWCVRISPAVKKIYVFLLQMYAMFYLLHLQVIV